MALWGCLEGEAEIFKKAIRMELLTVNLIGAGRVGQTLLRLLSDLPDFTVQDVLSNSFASAEEAVRFAGSGRAVKDYVDLQQADIWVLAVPDTKIAQVATQISDTFVHRPQGNAAPVAFHCSGFFPANEMIALRDLGWHLASVHPVLTFATPERAVSQFKSVLCGVEGDEAALEVVRPLLRKIGARDFSIRSESKSLYHAAAVISNNFTVVLQAIAREAWAEAGVSQDIAEQLNDTMLRATYENVSADGPRAALTGPAARGDTFVVSRQGEDVANWDPAVGNVYKELSKMARRLKAEGEVLDP